jgi:hypothetical protein
MESVPEMAGSISVLERVEPEDDSFGSGCIGDCKGYQQFTRSESEELKMWTIGNSRSHNE